MIKQKKRTAEIMDINSLKKLTNNPSQFWKKIRTIKSNNKVALNLISPTEWYNYFSKLGNAGKEDVHDSYKNQHKCIENELENMLKDQKQKIITELDKLFTQKEVEECIDKLKNNKASGNDSISNEMLKSMKKIVSSLIAELFNKIKLTEYYPELWEVGTITPLHKTDDIGNPDNYRGITLNSCLSKLFTKIMNDRLDKYIEDNNLIDYNQIGFRKDFRASDHVFVIKTLIEKYLSTGKRLYMCFIDFKKAYDTIWREGLFYKLLKQGISKTFVRLLINIYSRQRSCVNLGENVTKQFNTSTGLKQGCNLSPNLFNLFIQDITKCFNDSKCDPARLISENINCLLYADDLVLISETPEGLQNCLDNLYEYIKTWKLSINYTKTKIMLLSRRKTKSKIVFKVGIKEIDLCNSYKYLGTQIAENGSYKENSVMLNKKALAAMFTILKTVNKYYAGNVRILLELFDKMVVPIALYNSEIWGSILLPSNGKQTNYLSECNLVNIVEKLQNRFLKYILGVNMKSTNWVVRSELGRNPLTMRVYERIIKYFQHIYKSKSRIVQDALTVSKDLDQKGIKSWYTGYQRILKFTELDENKVIELKHNSKLIKITMTNLHEKTWQEERKKKQLLGKHQIYAEIKTKNSFEKYFDIENINIRKAISKIRISSHKFPIETGRYEKRDKNNRICPLCCNGIGDEHNYICECENQVIKNTRDEYMKIIYKKSPQIVKLSSFDKFKYMFICKDDTLMKDIGILFLKIQKAFDNNI